MQVPSSRGGVIEEGDVLFLAEDMDLAVKAAKEFCGADGTGQGEAGFAGRTFPKTEDAIDLVFAVFVRALDLDGQNAAVRLMLTDDFDGLIHFASSFPFRVSTGSIDLLRELIIEHMF